MSKAASKTPARAAAAPPAPARTGPDFSADAPATVDVAGYRAVRVADADTSSKRAHADVLAAAAGLRERVGLPAHTPVVAFTSAAIAAHLDADALAKEGVILTPDTALAAHVALVDTRDDAPAGAEGTRAGGSA